MTDKARLAPTSERRAYADLDTSDEARLAHWRGFTKYMQPDGTVFGIGCRDSKGTALVLGPCVDGREVDQLIRDFYASK